MALKHVLGVLTFVLFLAYFQWSKNKRSAYLFSVICLFPFLDLHLTNDKFGMIGVFDAMSYFALLYFIKDFFFTLNIRKVYFVLILILCVVLFIGGVTSEFVNDSLISSFKYVSIFVFAKLLIDECIASPQFSGIAIKWLKISCLFSLVFLAIQMVVGLKFTFYPDLNPNTTMDGIRYPSYFRDPQIFAQYLSMSAFLFLIKMPGDKIKEASYGVGLFILVVIALFFTGGRAGLTGLCAGLAVLFLSGKNKFRLVVLCGFLAGYLFVVAFASNFAVFNRGQDVDESLAIRTKIWHETLRVYNENQALGVGMNNYYYYSLNHTNNGYYIIDNEIVPYGTESGYLKILVECGILGFVPLMLLLLLPLVTSVIAFFKHKANRNIFFLIAAVVCWLVSFATSNTIDDKRIIVLIGTLLCLLITSGKPLKQHV